MRAKLANLNHCAAPFLSRAAVNLCWYDYSIRPKLTSFQLTIFFVSARTAYLNKRKALDFGTGSAELRYRKMDF